RPSSPSSRATPSASRSSSTTTPPSWAARGSTWRTSTCGRKHAAAGSADGSWLTWPGSRGTAGAGGWSGGSWTGTSRRSASTAPSAHARWTSGRSSASPDRRSRRSPPRPLCERAPAEGREWSERRCDARHGDGCQGDGHPCDGGAGSGAQSDPRLRPRDRRAAFARRQWLKWEVAPLLTALREAGIEALLFKGFHLAEFVYPVPGSRFHSDVDLVLREGGIEQAGRIARELGWRGTPDPGDEAPRFGR